MQAPFFAPRSLGPRLGIGWVAWLSIAIHAAALASLLAAANWRIEKLEPQPTSIVVGSPREVIIPVTVESPPQRMKPRPTCAGNPPRGTGTP